MPTRPAGRREAGRHMANYHTNLFVVAASERDMLKVLRLCARNLLAYADETKLALEDLEGCESSAELYNQLRGSLEGWYYYALSGASAAPAHDADGPDADQGAGAVTWGVNVSSRAYLADGDDRIANYLSNLLGVPSSEIHVSTAPTARPLSDAAESRFDEYAGTFVLSMTYSTAWEPNSEDIDAFFTLLEPGDYGVAFLDADEGDAYTLVSAFSGLHHGGCGLKDIASPSVDEDRDARDLQKDVEKCVQVRREDIHDLAELAYAVAVCRWPEYESAQHSYCADDYYEHCQDGEEGNFERWYEENFPDYINYEEEYEKLYPGEAKDGSIDLLAKGGRLSASSIEAKRVDWISPSKGDLAQIGRCLAYMVRLLPIHVMLDDENHPVNQDAIASALAGDEVVITSTWLDSRSRAPVELAITTPDGVEYGRLGNGHLWSMTDSGGEMVNSSATIACLLPHLSARVDKVMPIALRSGSARHSIFIVRIELRDGSCDRIEEDARALLALPCGERDGRSSVKRGR